MVKEAERRGKKYEAKVDAEVLRRQTTALKPLMVKGQRDYFPQIVTLEQRIKKLIEAKGVKTLQVRDYLNYGREILDLSKRFSGTTLNAEAQLKTDKWSARGLDGSTLVEVAQLVGVTPTAQPSVTVDFLPLIHDIPILKTPRTNADLLWIHSLLAGGTASGTIWDANTLIVTPFPLTRKIRFDRIGFFSQNSVPNAKVRLGLYDVDGLNNPRNLLAQSEELDCSFPSLKETSIDLTLEKGLYWLCAVSNKTLNYPFPSCWLSMIPSETSNINNGELYKTDYPYQAFPSTFPYDVGSPLYGEIGITLFALRIKELL